MANDNDFPLEKDAYLTFDALTLKEHIKTRLNESGVWTDQNYEGSNISTMIDIVAYTFNTLIYYLNRTSSESLFSDAQLYENMNRIVKILDYKPVGNQTSTLAFQSSATGTGETASVGLYTIPRYSYVNVNGIFYSFNEDITFAKKVADVTEPLTELSQQKLLYQGQFIEYPVYTAIGEENEIVFIAPGENVIIDHFNIDVYIKPQGGTWKKWSKANSLYLENGNSEKYELRYNENKIYELKFGNNINGKKLSANDEIAVYYLESDGSDGEIGAHTLPGKSLVKYETVQYNTILTDVVAGQYDLLSSLSNITFDNNSVSTYTSPEETVDDIRQHAPGVFRSQYRLVTQDDYQNYVKTNFANLIHDVVAVNNWTYLSEQVKYYYDLGITNPNNVSNVLYNQVLFADACNFNNVYILVVPKTIPNTLIPAATLSPAQKELIISSMRSEKTLTSEVVIVDPIYISASLGLPESGTTVTSSDVDQAEILIIKDPNSRRDDSSITNDVEKIFVDYFDRKNVTLGQVIDIKQMTADILDINGVMNFYTRRKDNTSIRVEGLTMILQNPIYKDDISLIVQNVALPYFKYPYLYDANNFSNNIVIQSDNKIYESIEY